MSNSASNSKTIRPVMPVSRKPPAARQPAVLPPANAKNPATRNPTTAAEATTERQSAQSHMGMIRIVRTVPAWFISLAAHAVLFLVLALCAFTLTQDEQIDYIHSSDGEVIDEIEDDPEIDVEPIEPIEIQTISTDSSNLEMGAIDIGDVSADVLVESNAHVGEVAFTNALTGELGALFGDDGHGMATTGDGMGGFAQFFGTKTSGKRFVFVVDNSNSMKDGRFETACTELVNTVDKMSPDQEFYLLFFSDQSYRLFHPQPAVGFVPATSANKARLKQWLYTVEMCLRTNGAEAMRAAIALKPDVIYILGDGAFGDDTEQLLVQPHQRKVPIHTIGMEVDGKGKRQLETIAVANHGTFRVVATTVAAQDTAKANPIERNSRRGPVWGLSLPGNKQ